MVLDVAFNPAPKLVAAIIDRAEAKRLESLLHEKRARFHYIMNGSGTASSEVLKIFGLSGTDKTVCVCVEPAARAGAFYTALIERLELTRPGRGIAFLLPVSSLSASVSNAFMAGITEQTIERRLENMDSERIEKEPELEAELILAVVGRGFSKGVMEAAKTAGARGGTIIHAWQRGAEEDIKFFGISIQEEKEIVAIVTPKTQKKELMQAISKACGSKTEAKGIVISLPIESFAGIELGAPGKEG
ncbi:MAG: hypothetical protein LBU36_01085 [Clostridiales bacterium]|nr:hypothetical protein [Clostridiales bacterium]